ncbi:MAG: hypothetical protein P1T08_06990 [Acidimicrobiia bacterium]|nr:hypothetical protein [Acidimicrobiia bacterium]
MNDSKAAGSPDQLIEAATELAGLLRSFGEDVWAQWVERDVERIRAGDQYGVDHLLTAFGGMGSLSDLLIHPANGHDVEAADVLSANNQLTDLRARTAETARAIQRKSDRS